MKLFCPSCLDSLTINHEVVIKLSSRFDWKPDRILLTAHIINDMSGMKKMFSTDKIKSATCRKCGDVKFSDAQVQCDDCGDRLLHEAGVEIGSLIFCKRCIGSKRNFKDFDIFGKRAPTGKNRERVIDESLQDAFVIANADENINAEQMGQSINVAPVDITQAPQESVSPNFRVEIDGNNIDFSSDIDLSLARNSYNWIIDTSTGTSNE